MSDKLIITGNVGVNHELVELHNNFPRFNLLYSKEESEKELLAGVKKQGKLILESIKELKVDDDNVFLSNEGSDSKEVLTQRGEDPTSGAVVESKSDLNKRVLESVESCNHCDLIF